MADDRGATAIVRPNAIVIGDGSSNTEIRPNTGDEPSAFVDIDDGLGAIANERQNTVVTGGGMPIGASDSTGMDNVDHLVTFYDSDEEELTMSYIGRKFPIPHQSDTLPITFIKHENDRISGDRPYEDSEVCKNDWLVIEYSFESFSIVFFYKCLFRAVESISSEQKSYCCRRMLLPQCCYGLLSHSVTAKK